MTPRAYRDQRARENAWKVVEDTVRELRKKKLSGEAGPEFKSSWDLFDLLTFLTDTVKHRP